MNHILRIALAVSMLAVLLLTFDLAQQAAAHNEPLRTPTHARP